MLPFYAERFDTVEINNTFYRLPTAAAVKKWRSAVPKNFCFAVNASRYLSHMKKLNPKSAPRITQINADNFGSGTGR
jgi:uncharacterized protein YecE (DUF72 family)